MKAAARLFSADFADLDLMMIGLVSGGRALLGPLGDLDRTLRIAIGDAERRCCAAGACI